MIELFYGRHTENYQRIHAKLKDEARFLRHMLNDLKTVVKLFSIEIHSTNWRDFKSDSKNH